MKVTFSVDDDVVKAARRRAEAMGTTVNQLIREYLEQFAGKSYIAKADATEFRQLSLLSAGDSRGWKFNRDEIHERR